MLITSPLSFSTRQDMEDFWCRRLREARIRYQETTAQYRMLFQEPSDGKAHDPNGPLALARIAQSEALAEYGRVLRIFTDLTVHGRIPDQQSTGRSNSA